MVLEALVEWWQSLGVVAWFGLGIMIAAAILSFMMLVRWIFRGGLARYTSFSFSGRRREPEESPPEDL